MTRYSALAVALVSLLALQQASAFRVWLNLNQMSKTMADRPDLWDTVIKEVHGVLGLGAVNFFDPMGLEGWRTMFKRFRNKPQIMVSNWQLYKGSRKGSDGSNLLQQTNAKYGSKFDTVFIWDEDQPGSTLNLDQLDEIQRDGYYSPVLVNSRGFRESSREEVYEILAHPHVKGVMCEGSAFAYDIGSSVTEVAAHVMQNTTKEAYFLVNWTQAGAMTLPETIDHLLEQLRAIFGDATLKSDRFNIILAGYGRTPNGRDLLPETNPDGTPADSFTGSAYHLIQQRDKMYESGVGYPVCSVNGKVGYPEGDVGKWTQGGGNPLAGKCRSYEFAPTW